MKLQGSGVFHPKTLQSQNCQPAENRLSLNGLEFVHGQPFKPNLTRDEEDVRIAMLTAKLKLQADPPHTL